jgi:hypothetical protein
VPAATAKDLLLVADQRGGIEGRLWLAACVVKFGKDG